MFGANFSLRLSDFDAIARKSGLILRYSHKFSAAGFLLALLRSVTKGDCSLREDFEFVFDDGSELRIFGKAMCGWLSHA